MSGNVYAAREAWNRIHSSAEGTWIALFPFDEWAFRRFAWVFISNPAYRVYNFAYEQITPDNDPGLWQDHGIFVVREMY